MTQWEACTGAGSWQGPGKLRRGVNAGVGLLAGLVIAQGTHMGAVCSRMTSPCGKGHMPGHLMTNRSLGKDSHCRSLRRTVSCGRDAGAAVRTPLPEEEAAAETTCGEQVNPHSPSPCTTGGEEVENQEQS